MSMDLVEHLPSLMDNRDRAADAARHIAVDSSVRLWSESSVNQRRLSQA